MGVVIGVLTGFLNGFFGSGGGTVAVPCMTRFMRVPAKAAHATAVAVILPLSIISAAVYLRGSSVDLGVLAVVSICGAAGGFAGARLLKKITPKALHRLFGAFMLAAAVKMIL
ncbi:MAG: sulfite exporter TauE/SafE family protein [Spirochaetaceae bacterium]|jgi:uncharacterized membrane protein YfcA|nr:sulfite exporter TauE/SafE family protein [Spirochaetaceae bacterium]